MQYVLLTGCIVLILLLGRCVTCGAIPFSRKDIGKRFKLLDIIDETDVAIFLCDECQCNKKPRKVERLVPNEIGKLAADKKQGRSAVYTLESDLTLRHVSVQ